jgi:hypothetical protein
MSSPYNGRQQELIGEHREACGDCHQHAELLGWPEPAERE